MNKSRIEKYLLEKTNKLVFITLDDIILKKIEGININKNIEVPVFSSVLIDMANSKRRNFYNRYIKCHAFHTRDRPLF